MRTMMKAWTMAALACATTMVAAQSPTVLRWA